MEFVHFIWLSFFLQSQIIVCLSATTKKHTLCVWWSLKQFDSLQLMPPTHMKNVKAVSYSISIWKGYFLQTFLLESHFLFNFYLKRLLFKDFLFGILFNFYLERLLFTDFFSGMPFLIQFLFETGTFWRISFWKSISYSISIWKGYF